MAQLRFEWIRLVFAIGFSCLQACSFAQGQAGVVLNPAEDGRRYTAEFRSTRPTSAITLARTPDATRKDRWVFESTGFEIVQLGGKDIIRRTDGGQFSTVKVSVPATYVPLPKDYAPFSPFSDGGLLIHSGRFQACPSSLENGIEDCDGPWLMKINSPPDAHILLNGERYDDSAQWLDSDNGTKIYVGPAVPHAGVDFIGVVDPALPPTISNLISTSLPDLMTYYGERLPELEQRPMLFVSYEPAYEQGHGRQGGVLPNQVFMHFYGPTWEGTESSSSTPMDVIWFFAHEAGHIFQHGITGNRESAWIHEGAAEAFAYLALRDLNIVSDVYLDTRRHRAREECRKALRKGSLAAAADRGDFSDYYQCGLTMFIAINEEVLLNSRNQQDVFDLWSALVSELPRSDPLDAMTFLGKAEQWIGRDLARQLLSMSIDSQDNPDQTLTQMRQ